MNEIVADAAITVFVVDVDFLFSTNFIKPLGPGGVEGRVETSSCVEFRILCLTH